MNPALAPEALDVARYYAGGWALLPEYIVCFGAALLLLLEAFAGVGGRRAGYAAAITLGLAFVAALFAPGGASTVFSGMVVVDPFFRFFRYVFIAAGLLGILLALQSEETNEGHEGEYYSLLLGLVAGMMFLAAASDIVMLYVALELVSLMSYVLAGFRRHDRKGAEAALKYVIYGGAASGAMLFGLSLLYGLTGHTQISLIGEAVASAARASTVASLGTTVSAGLPAAYAAALVLTFAGFGYKIAAAPLHMWSPDVYEGAPTPFTAFLSTGPKAAGFAALLRFFFVAFSDPAGAGENLLVETSTIPWQLLVIVAAIATMLVGNLAAIGQSNIKRFLAYSSIAHAGYSLVGLAAFSRSGASSVLLYMVFYLVMNVGAFYAVIWVRDRLGSERIEDYRGLGTRAPLVAVCLAICLFSLTGLPPLAGFIGKYYLFASVVERGLHLPVIAECLPAMRSSLGLGQKLACSLAGSGAYYALAVIGVLNSAVSLYYYARVVRNMFLAKADDPTPVEVDLPARLVLVPAAAFLVVAGIYWAPIESRAVAAIDFRRPTQAEIQTAPTPSTAGAPSAGAAAALEP